MIIISSTITIMLIVLFLTYPLKVGTKLNLIDKVEKTYLKIHLEDTPKIGGIIIFILVTQLYLVLAISTEMTIKNLSSYIFFASFFFIGIIDDYLNVKPLKRIFLYSVVCIIFTMLNKDLLITEIYLEILNRNLSTIYLSFIFTLFCFLALQNSLNFIDGINGSLITVSISIVIVLLNINFRIEIALFLLVFVLLLYKNVNNKIFLGNNGSSIISSLLGFWLIIYHKEFPEILSSERILIILLLPGIDMIRVSITRILNNKNPFVGDLNHFHHIVLQKFKYYLWIPTYILLIFIFYSSSFYINSYVILITMILLYIYLMFKFKEY